MSKDEVGPIMRVMVIEDNPGDARLVKEALADSTGVEAEFAARLDLGIEAMKAGSFDVVLLDLALPDSEGFDTVVRLGKEVPDVPMVVLTVARDRESSEKALALGAQDYLAKSNLYGESLVRSLRYAIIRNRLRTLERQAHATMENELAQLEVASKRTPTGATASLYSASPLADYVPDSFNELADRFIAVLDGAIEERKFRTDNKVSEQLSQMAQDIGFLRGGPRDVIDVYSSAVRRATAEANREKAKAYLEEARLRVLELMGNLAAFYRRYSHVAPAVRASVAPGRQEGT